MKKSNVPKSEEGKQQSRKNAYQHSEPNANTLQWQKLMPKYARLEREKRSKP